MIRISEPLRFLMKKEKIKVPELAKKLSVNNAIIYNALKTDGYITPENLEKLSNYFDIPSFYFSCYTEESPISQLYVGNRMQKARIQANLTEQDVVDKINALTGAELTISHLRENEMMKKYPDASFIGLFCGIVHRSPCEIYYGTVEWQTTLSNSGSFQNTVLQNDMEEAYLQVVDMELRMERCDQDEDGYIKIKKAGLLPDDIMIIQNLVESLRNRNMGVSGYVK